MSQRINPSQRYFDQEFGTSVAISGNYAIIGAPRDSRDSTGPNGIPGAGAAFIFEKDSNGLWVEQQKLLASDREMGDQFGMTVSISGTHAIVGVPYDDKDAMGGNPIFRAGSAYVFEQDSTGTWHQVSKIDAGTDRDAYDEFGMSVSISGDYAIVGTKEEELDPSGSNPITLAGAAYIYERNSSGTWTFAQKIVNTDRAGMDEFGFSVSIDGNMALVGAISQSRDTAGSNIAVEAGAMYLFEKNNNGTWIEIQKLVAADRAPGDCLGWSVSLRNGVAMVGAPFRDYLDSLGTYLFDVGAVYFFEPNAIGHWVQVSKFISPNYAEYMDFGINVAVSDQYAVVGQPKEQIVLSPTLGYRDGVAYIFERHALGGWELSTRIVLVESIPNDDSLFGSSVAVSDSVIMVGAKYEGEDANEANFFNSAGAVAFFEKCVAEYSLSVEACGSYLSPSGTQLWTESGSYTDTLSSILACDSIFLIDLLIHPIEVAIDTISPQACQAYVSPSGAYIWTSSGTYADTILNELGCDSLIYRVELSIDSVSTAISQDGFQLTVLDSTATSYQWLDCSNGYAAIPGATQQTFVPDENGNYAVQLSGFACTDTSDCISVSTVGKTPHSFESQIRLYPNPTSKEFMLDLGTTLEEVELVVRNPLGQIISSQRYRHTDQIQMDISGTSGAYLLEIRSTDGRSANMMIWKE